ncbi:MAG: NAD(P)/FAD-dependent oxidoreductase [Archaeoglobus sp.]|nr:NAD(P)/FAD-dependent oxidoreductase [Archaeoglobus sp.]
MKIKNQIFDVTIIGAGVTGCFIAKELSKYKLRVLVVEKEPTVAMGPTKGCSGIIHAFQLPFGSLKGKLCLEGNKLMDEEAKELGFRFKRVGLLLICKSFLSSLVARIVKPYFSRYLEVRYLGEEEIKELEPNVEAKGGLLFPSGGVVNPVEMTFKAKLFAELNGVEFRFESKVVGIDVIDVVDASDIGNIGDVSEVGEVGGVTDSTDAMDTTMGTVMDTTDTRDTADENPYFEVTLESEEGEEKIISRYVINCAGLYADEIAAMVGDKIKIIPGKGSHVVFEDKDFSYHLIAVLPLMPERKTKGGGSLVTIDGNLIWGPNLVDVENKEDRSVKKEEVDALIKKHSKPFKKLPEKAVSVYAGVRAIAGKDFIINSPIKNFINVAGIQSPGLTAAPAIARLVVRILKESLEKKGLRLEKKEEKSLKLISSREQNVEPICHCRNVSSDEICRIISDGAGTLDDVKHLTGATMECGRCLPAVLQIMEEKGLPLRKDTCKSFIAWRD